MCRPIYAVHFIQRWVNFDILPHLRASRLRRVMRSHRGATGVMYVAVRQRGLRVPAITWGRGRCSPGPRVTGMSRRAGAGRGATSRPVGTGDHLVPVPVFSWPPGYRDQPPGGRRSCAGLDATSRPAGTGDHLGLGPVFSWPPGYRDEPPGGCRSGGRHQGLWVQVIIC